MQYQIEKVEFSGAPGITKINGCRLQQHIPITNWTIDANVVDSGEWALRRTSMDVWLFNYYFILFLFLMKNTLELWAKIVSKNRENQNWRPHNRIGLGWEEITHAFLYGPVPPLFVPSQLSFLDSPSILSYILLSLKTPVRQICLTFQSLVLAFPSGSQFFLFAYIRSGVQEIQ